MARIPRMYEVRSFSTVGEIKLRHYQTPEAAEARAERFRLADPTAIVSVTASHPITYPRPAGDPTPFDVPDSLINATKVEQFLELCGLKPSAVSLAMFTPAEVVLEYQPDSTGKRAPKLWRVSITE